MGREAPLSPPGEGERRDTSSGKYEGTCARTLPAANGADGSENGPARRIRKLCAGVPAYARNCHASRANAHANFRRTRRTPRPHDSRDFRDFRDFRGSRDCRSQHDCRQTGTRDLSGDKPLAAFGVPVGLATCRGTSHLRRRQTQTGRSAAVNARCIHGRESGLARSQTR